MLDFNIESKYAVRFKDADCYYHPNQFTSNGNQLSKGSRYKFSDSIDFYSNSIDSAKLIALEFGRVFYKSFSGHNWDYVNQQTLVNRIIIPHFDETEFPIHEEIYKIILYSHDKIFTRDCVLTV